MTGRTQDGDTVTVMAPKDAEGREIPLDTKRLYDADGVPVVIRAFRYNPNDRCWRVERLDGLGTPRTTRLRLTAPDSWERLEDDLDRGSDICGYYEDCPMEMYGKSCSGCKKAALKNIASRIRKLRGEGE